MKKELFSLLLSAALLVSATACNRSDMESTESISGSDDTENIHHETLTEQTLDSCDEFGAETSMGSFREQCHLSGSFNGYYIKKAEEILLINENERSYFYIPEWGKSFSIQPWLYQPGYSCPVCGTTIGNLAYVFAYADYSKTELTMIKMDHTNNELVQRTIALSTDPEGDLQSGYLFCSMLDESNGFLFIFTETNFGGVLKTKDGWESWQEISCDTSLKYYRRDIPIYANFFDETTAMISCRYACADFLSDRTFITFDGGKTWEKFPDLPYPKLNYSFSTDLADVVKEDGQYLITVRLYNSERPHQYILFSSTDLKTWTFVGWL